jgi:hypothetical protein
MGKKRDEHFRRIAAFKARFSKQTTEALAKRLNTGLMVTEAAIAAREIIDERERSGGQQRPANS